MFPFRRNAPSLTHGWWKPSGVRVDGMRAIILREQVSGARVPVISKRGEQYPLNHDSLLCNWTHLHVCDGDTSVKIPLESADATMVKEVPVTFYGRP